MTKNDPSTSQDAWLASFTDQLLNGKVDSPPADGPDPEMRALAGTLLRLKNAFPKQELDQSSVKRMKNQVLRRWQEEEQKRSRWTNIFRLDWLTPSRRQQVGLAFAMLTIVGMLIVAAPYLFSSSGQVTATAGTGLGGTFVWIVLVLLVVIVGWLLRKKT